MNDRIGHGSAAGGGRRAAASGCRAAAMVVLAVISSAACTTTIEAGSNARPMPPAPIAPPPLPADAKVNAIVFTLVGPKALDTNGNGRADLIPVEAYLFAEPHPTPVFAPGEFVFEMYPLGGAAVPGAKPVSTWRIGGAKADAGRAFLLVGPCYRFSLSLLETSGDVLPFTAADLTAAFYPADGGPPIRGSGVRTVQLGMESAAVSARPPRGAPAPVPGVAILDPAAQASDADVPAAKPTGP